MKKKVKNRFNSVVLSVVLLGGTIFLLIPVIEEVGNTFRLSETLKEVEAQLVLLEQENTSLNEQKTKLLDPEYVKSYARANYMLTKEGEQIYYLPKDDEQDND
ncbi:MAG: septum formation initiator family protein [Erysipelotrichaceae bacterium]|jgi:cell division protein DivIC|nr:septum formation initiator family protein [Erysipelotrichaceae bacterium]